MSLKGTCNLKMTVLWSPSFNTPCTDKTFLETQNEDAEVSWSNVNAHKWISLAGA